MGTDIFSRAQRQIDGRWESIPGLHPFARLRSYRIWGFLADVRNSSVIDPISRPRGLPPGESLPADFDETVGSYEDFLEWEASREANWLGAHSHSWLLVSELVSVNYDQLVEDRQYAGIVDGKSGKHTLSKGRGKTTSLRSFLGHEFFEELATMQAAGVQRIVFGFDH